MRIPRIVVSSGEPAGIGPDICVTLSQADLDCELIIAGDARLLSNAAAALGADIHFEEYSPAVPRPQRAGHMRILDLRTETRVVAGRLDPRNSAYVLRMLDRACDGCMNGEFAAMVTAPVQKSVIMQAGFEFTGHTEYLAARCRAALPVMMLVAAAGPNSTGPNSTGPSDAGAVAAEVRPLRVALVTTHLALADVPRAITAERLRATLKIVHQDMERLFGIASPRILLLGLNPHAGESGYLGREEIDVIAPVARDLQAAGMRITGPVPADTAFTPKLLRESDVVLAMYHDQGLPVLKFAGFGQAVNVTLGLPIIRTSVDHGTALDLARSGRADAGSLRAALDLAIDATR